MPSLVLIGPVVRPAIACIQTDRHNALYYVDLHGLTPQYLGPLDRVTDLPGRRALRSSGCQPSPVDVIKSWQE